jgi:hypothetical protein
MPRCDARAAALAVIAIVVAGCGATGCLSATPPKTPNQRAVERAERPVPLPSPPPEPPPRPVAP